MKNKTFTLMSSLVIGIFMANSANAEIYPVASCKSWDGSINYIRGKNSSNAKMVGTITYENVKEYCTRGIYDKVEITKCIDQNIFRTTHSDLKTTANCDLGTLTFYYDDPERKFSKSLNFNVQPSNTSCASGVPVLMLQFRLLCPIKYKNLRIDDWY
jgi:hypothetical protein